MVMFFVDVFFSIQFIPYIHTSVDNSFYYATPHRKILIYVSPVNQRTE